MSGCVRLEVMLSAEIPMPSGYVYRAEGSRLARLRAALRTDASALQAPCLSYAVWHSSAGVILIDTGLDPDARLNRRRDFGLAMGLFFRALRPARQPFDAQLRAIDVDPAKVERVLMTHLHVDHTSGMRLLPAARFTCTRAEWQAANARFGAVSGYVRHHLPPVTRVDRIDFDDAEPYGPFAKTRDLLGDGSIRLISTPGHTPGHQSVLLRLDDGRTVLVVGDAAYTMRSIDEQILPARTADDAASIQSLRELRAFAQAEPDAILVPTHDPEAWRQLTAS